MSQFKKVLAFAVSSFVVVLVGLALINRAAAKVPALRSLVGRD